MCIKEGTKERKSNDYLWQEAGFRNKVKKENNFSVEIDELEFIISYIHNLELDNFNRIYAELIAIKPGFHEIWIHDDYFDEKNYPSVKDAKENARNQVFRLLKGIGNLIDIKLEKLPNDTKNSNSYIRYATCNITEGPFVFRKSVSVSYFDEIRRIKSKKGLDNLKSKFVVLDYYHNGLNSREEGGNLLKDAERFKCFV